MKEDHRGRQESPAHQYQTVRQLFMSTAHLSLESKAKYPSPYPPFNDRYHKLPEWKRNHIPIAPTYGSFSRFTPEMNRYNLQASALLVEEVKKTYHTHMRKAVEQASEQSSLNDAIFAAGTACMQHTIDQTPWTLFPTRAMLRVGYYSGWQSILEALDDHASKYLFRADGYKDILTLPPDHFIGYVHEGHTAADGHEVTDRIAGEIPCLGMGISRAIMTETSHFLRLTDTIAPLKQKTCHMLYHDSPKDYDLSMISQRFEPFFAGLEATYSRKLG